MERDCVLNSVRDHESWEVQKCAGSQITYVDIDFVLLMEVHIEVPLLDFDV
jgi:hypothetical protein